MNIPVIDGNRIDMLPPVSTPDSFVTLRAEMSAGHGADQRARHDPDRGPFRDRLNGCSRHCRTGSFDALLNCFAGARNQPKRGGAAMRTSATIGKRFPASLALSLCVLLLSGC